MRAVSAASVDIVVKVINAAPDNHFSAGPDGGVIIPTGGGIGDVGGHPTVCVRIVSGAGVKKVVVNVRPTPDDHLAVRPDCGVTRSRRGCIGRVSG